MTQAHVPAAPARSPIIGYAGGMFAVAGATAAGLLIAQIWGSGPVVLLYIPAVLATAVTAGLWPALSAAVVSALAYNYYFTAPYRTFLIHNPADIVTVIVLLLVAVVTSQLASRLRAQALRADAHAARNATIAGFARKLLSCPTEGGIADATVQELSRLFRCNAVMLSSDQPPRLLAAAPPGATLTPGDDAAAATTAKSGKPTGRGMQKVHVTDWQFHPVSSENAVIAVAGMARDDSALPVATDQQALLVNLLDQVALALARAHLERGAREVATLRERDKLRSVLLMSIGQDVKPRLNAIGAAARALKRVSQDKDLAARVAAEAVTLERYIDTLVDVSPGADPQTLEIGALEIDLHRRTVRKNGAEVRLTPKEYAVLAELARHAGRVLTHTHLLKAVWGPAQATQIDYLRVAIRALRQKLESDPARPCLIVNEPAVGYRLALG